MVMADQTREKREFKEGAQRVKQGASHCGEAWGDAWGEAGRELGREARREAGGEARFESGGELWGACQVELSRGRATGEGGGQGQGVSQSAKQGAKQGANQGTNQGANGHKAVGCRERSRGEKQRASHWAIRCIQDMQRGCRFRFSYCQRRWPRVTWATLALCNFCALALSPRAFQNYPMRAASSGNSALHVGSNCGPLA